MSCRAGGQCEALDADSAELADGKTGIHGGAVHVGGPGSVTVADDHPQG
ncbi:hypothetical protein ACQPW1_48760 [Nocardia sp. CA-128927]